jgi:hypothetical protein
LASDITNQLLYQLSYNSVLKGGELYLLAPPHGNAVATALPWISVTNRLEIDLMGVAPRGRLGHESRPASADFRHGP